MSIRVIFASAAALALAAGAPAHAAKGKTSQALAAEDGGSGERTKSERKTCRNFENTASRMKRERLCLTREQWKKFDAGQSDR